MNFKQNVKIHSRTKVIEFLVDSGILDKFQASGDITEKLLA